MIFTAKAFICGTPVVSDEETMASSYANFQSSAMITHLLHRALVECVTPSSPEIG